MSLLDRVKPGISRRVDFALRRNKCALLIIDVQKYLTYPEHEYFHKFALPRAMKNIETMAHQFRAVRDTPNATGCEVIFTYVQSSTKDGRDMSLDYKLSGPMLANIPRIGDTDIFVPDCTPDPHTGKGDILLPKTSCSVFQSTNIDYLLRNLGIEQIVVCGQLTDECVESAVRDGADLGYLMTVPEDACAAISPERHKIGLQGMHGFCRILKTAHITWEIAESVEAFRSENISLEALTTFLKGRGFADAAIEVASAFSGNGHSKSPSSPRRTTATAIVQLDEGGTNDTTSNDDVVTVSSAVMDNIVLQQKTVSKRSVKNPGVHTQGSPKVTTISPRTMNYEQNASTPPTRNGSLTLPRYNNVNGNDPSRGRDPSELIATPDLSRPSSSGNVSTSMTSTQYHSQMNSNRTKPSSPTASLHRTSSGTAKSSQTRHRNSIPIDLDDSPEQAKNHRWDPPEVTNELLEL